MYEYVIISRSHPSYLMSNKVQKIFFIIYIDFLILVISLNFWPTDLNLFCAEIFYKACVKCYALLEKYS